MSNFLTGEYDIVLEIAGDAVDRVLAYLHRQGASDTASPKLLHGVTARVGSLPSDWSLALAELLLDDYFGAGKVDIGKIPPEKLASMQQDIDTATAAAGKLTSDLASMGEPPAAAGPWQEALGTLAALTVVRGTGQVQIGAPTLALDAVSATQISMRANIRALYKPDPGTNPLPEPIHGEVLATFLPTYNPSGANGKPALEIKLKDGGEWGASFTPDPGTSLTAADAKRLSHEVRRFVQSRFGPMSVPLPDDFPFREFKILPGGSSKSVIALPIKRDGQAPQFAIDAVNINFLNSGDDFAIAIGKDFINGLVLPHLQQFVPLFYFYEVDDPFGGTVFHFQISFNNVAVNWSIGTVEVVISGNTQQWGWAIPDGGAPFHITVTLSLHLVQDGAKQKVSLQTDNVDYGSLTGTIYAAFVVPEFTKTLDTVMPKLVTSVENLFASMSIDGALRTFDPNALTRYLALEVRSDGVILRGRRTDVPNPAPVVVDFAPTPDGTALTAFNSWVPGGTIDKFDWSWVTRDSSNQLPWAGTPHEQTVLHSFLFQWIRPLGTGRQAPPPWQTGQVCLSIEGTQLGDQVSGASACSVMTPEWLGVLVAGWNLPLPVPVWGPDPALEAALDSGIVAFINVAPQAAAAAEARTSVLVHFADGGQAPLPAMGDALRRSRHKEAGVPVIVVLPRGTLSQRRSIVEASLGSLGPDLALPLVVTEDYEGAWTQAFGASGGAATHLVSPTGEISWHHRGTPHAEGLSTALDQHAIAGTLRRSRRLPRALRVGAPIPAVFYEHARDHVPPGRRVILMFWKSWSTPCIKELCRLQQVHERAGARGPAILTIADGADREVADTIIRQHGLKFPVLPDPHREIARKYAINCWPTLIGISENGLVGGIQSGATHPRRPRTPSPAGAGRRSRPA